MTFAARTFMGVSLLPGVITSPTASCVNTAIVTGILSAGFTLASNGAQTVNHGSGSAAWFNPLTAGIGSSVWVKLTVVTSTNTNVSGTTGSWVSLSAGTTWNFSNTLANNEGTGSFTLSFATDSGGANVVGSGSGTWDVGFTP